MIGGYQMIDCKGMELTSSEKLTISGIYNDVNNAYQIEKLVLACNCLWDGAKVTPVPVFITKLSNDTFTATSSILQLVIDSEDGVTINSLVE